MGKVSVTYNMPTEDDSPVVSTGGKRFFDGQAIDLDEDADGELITRLRTNQHFVVGEGSAPAFESPAPLGGTTGNDPGHSTTWGTN